MFEMKMFVECQNQEAGQHVFLARDQSKIFPQRNTQVDMRMHKCNCWFRSPMLPCFKVLFSSSILSRETIEIVVLKSLFLSRNQIHIDAFQGWNPERRAKKRKEPLDPRNPSFVNPHVGMAAGFYFLFWEVTIATTKKSRLFIIAVVVQGRRNVGLVALSSSVKTKNRPLTNDDDEDEQHNPAHN